MRPWISAFLPAPLTIVVLSLSIITFLARPSILTVTFSSAAMDDLEDKHEVKADQRVDQFLRLRDAIDRRPDNAGERCGPLRGAFPDVAQKQKQKSNEDCDI